MSARENREGLTYVEWLRAAWRHVEAEGVTRTTREQALYVAWKCGEDPTEWRAAGERSCERLERLFRSGDASDLIAARSILSGIVFGRPGGSPPRPAGDE